MDFENYTERARGFLQSAQGLAVRSNHQRFTTEHLLKVLLDDEQGMAASLIAAAGGDAKQALQQTELALGKLPKVEGSGAGQVYLAPELARVFEQAGQLATKAGDKFGMQATLLILAGLKAIPVIMFSNSDDENDISQAYAHHCNGYIQKPMHSEQMDDFARVLTKMWTNMLLLPESSAA